jgi:environmental stress-induced protein Ves
MVGRHRALAFAGEAQVATRGLGAPTRALNVMTTRGKCHATVCVVGRDVDPGADVTLAVHLGAHRADICLVPTPASSS